MKVLFLLVWVFPPLPPIPVSVELPEMVAQQFMLQPVVIQPEFLLVKENPDGSVIERRNPLYTGPKRPPLLAPPRPTEFEGEQGTVLPRKDESYPLVRPRKK